MPRFFVSDAGGEFITVTGADAVHIGISLRMAKGENITLCSGGKDFECEIVSISPEEVVCKVLSSSPSGAEPDVKLTLFQALPKGDKFEFIIQKAVELGASKVVPVLTKRCISRPDERSFEKKLERYRKIALEAAKQSGRGIIPEISGIMKWDEAVKTAAESDAALICYENEGGKRFSEIDFSSMKSVSLLVGSEGGFDFDEVEHASQAGCIPIWMGKRILRCETAPIAAISVIMSMSGNL